MSKGGITDSDSVQQKSAQSFTELDSAVTRGLEARQSSLSRTVDVIVPVYKGLQVTLDCLTSVLQSDASSSANIIVIDDQSPERQLSDALEYMAAKGLITLIKNDVNLGFVRSVNLGMSQSSNDVILLNSDTIVYGNWVQRLIAQAESGQKCWLCYAVFR